MAARKTKHLSDEWRKKIQTSMLINRLTDFVNSKVELNSAQVAAALGLLKKSLPDLQAVQHSGDKENPIEINTRDLTGQILSQLPDNVLEDLITQETQH